MFELWWKTLYYVLQNFTATSSYCKSKLSIYDFIITNTVIIITNNWLYQGIQNDQVWILLVCQRNASGKQFTLLLNAPFFLQTRQTCSGNTLLEAVNHSLLSTFSVLLFFCIRKQILERIQENFENLPHIIDLNTLYTILWLHALSSHLQGWLEEGTLDMSEIVRVCVLGWKQQNTSQLWLSSKGWLCKLNYFSIK